MPYDDSREEPNQKRKKQKRARRGRPIMLVAMVAASAFWGVVTLADAAFSAHLLINLDRSDRTNERVLIFHGIHTVSFFLFGLSILLGALLLWKRSAIGQYLIFPPCVLMTIGTLTHHIGLCCASFGVAIPQNVVIVKTIIMFAAIVVTGFLAYAQARDDVRSQLRE
jgi:hypothetical protein